MLPRDGLKETNILDNSRADHVPFSWHCLKPSEKLQGTDLKPQTSLKLIRLKVKMQQIKVNE